MVIRGRAPLRVSFGGGGTDVAPFCVEQGGAIIGSTMANKHCLGLPWMISKFFLIFFSFSE